MTSFTDMATGIYPDISMSEYQAHPGISSNQLRAVMRPGGRARVKAMRDNVCDDRPEYLFGRAVHALVFDPATAPEIRCDARLEPHATSDAIVLTPYDYDRACAMEKAFHEDPIVTQLLKYDGAPEETILWNDPETGMACKARPDFRYHEGGPYRGIIEYKTTTDASPKGFAEEIARYGYDQQAAWYLTGLEAAESRLPLTATFIAQETYPPYLCAVYQLDPQTLTLAQRVNDEAKHRIAASENIGSWHGYTTDSLVYTIPRLPMPAWRYEQITRWLH